MLVSVIVPIYNSENYLADTLNSILASDYPHFEVVCVDDGSHDGSLAIAQGIASTDSRVKVYSQSNGGACRARNYAISLASGELILPIDSDDKISPTYISRAAQLLISNPDAKVVIPRAEFFDNRVGEWRLPQFSLSLLARKNMIPACAMYRKADWQRVGGYCPDFKTREDWAFWIAVLKDGGKVLYLPTVEFFYRIRPTSKRVTNRHLKSDVVDALNRLHPEFFERILWGPLRHQRTWSKFINLFYRIAHPRKVHLLTNHPELNSLANSLFPDPKKLEYWVKSLPVRWQNSEGTVIHRGRNELRLLSYQGVDMVVKSYATPNIVNRLVYGIFRKSKAQRSFEYAQKLKELGIPTPTPIAYYTERCGLLFSRSYFVSLKSSCRYTFHDIIAHPDAEFYHLYLTHVAALTAHLHEAGLYPLDYSGGNILLDASTTDAGYNVLTDLVDLNRMEFGPVDIHKGCRGFERLNASPEALTIMAKEYARLRNFNPETCTQLILKYRWHKHQK